MSDGPATTGHSSGVDIPVPKEVRSFDKTPMFSALHIQRYVRQKLILDIEGMCRDRGSPASLICYVANKTIITRDDIVGFVDLLQNIPANAPIDLLLHTPGGDVDAAEKMISLVRRKVGEDQALRIIVPDFAKSAGTLMALGANRIVMSDCSELGPIDPQYSLVDEVGNATQYSVLNYLQAFNQAKDALAKDPNDIIARLTFERFDPVAVQKFEAIRKRVQVFAEDLLKPRGTFYTTIVAELMNVDRLPAHGQMVSWEMAERYGLVIDYLDMGDELWRKYWSLYCHLRLAVPQDGQRIFESSYVSLVLE